MAPSVDARLAQRIREIASMEVDTRDGDVILPATEKSRILCIAADTLEEYIMDADRRDGMA